MAEISNLLQKVNSRLDELGHKLSAAEVAEARQRQEAQARADESAHLRSREHLLEVQSTARKYQARADEALEPWGIRSPGPVLGQPVSDYRRSVLDLARKQLPENHELRRVRPHRLQDDALEAIEPQILDAVKSAAHRPDSVPRGQYREVKEQDQSGRDITKFIGQESFVREFHRPSQRVVRLIARDANSGRERVLHGPPFSSRDS